MRVLSLVVALSASPALAETPLDAEAFAAATLGQTITYASDGQDFGSETYLGDGRTIWQYKDGPCVTGSYKPQGEALCFTYAGDPGPVCWRFFAVDGKLRGVLSDAGGPLTIITETARNATPLTCSPTSDQD